ncbi:hypothetical protein JW921_00940, partial [Candidatus Fermentibacterales bacterium]|nr:hypothetical protein [Candidatus Fermentibacterales bacterium]
MSLIRMVPGARAITGPAPAILSLLFVFSRPPVGECGRIMPCDLEYIGAFALPASEDWEGW